VLNNKWKKRFKRWFRLRFAILYPLGIWAVIFGHSTDESIMRSIWFILLGLGIRSWANCYAIKMGKLTTSGPYAYVRHPLYLGSFLIMGGFLIMVNINWIVILIFAMVVLGVVYKMTVVKEEEMLIDKFGNGYLEYKQSVPAFFPVFFPFKGGEKWGPRVERYLRSQEYKLFIWVIVLVIVFHLKEEFIVEKESVNLKHILWIVAAFLIGFLDFALSKIRKKFKKDPVTREECF